MPPVTPTPSARADGAGSAVTRVDPALTAAVRSHEAGRLGEADERYRALLRSQPDSPDVLQLLGLLNGQMGRTGIAGALIRKAIALAPERATYHNNLGNVLRAEGRAAEAAACFRHALQLYPGYALAHSNLLVTLHYIEGVSAEALAAEARAWGVQHAPARLGPSVPHTNDPDADRPLRVGYCSGELRRHPVAYFLEPVLRVHDAREVEVVCYSSSAKQDGLTERLKQYCAAWRDISGMADAAADALIRRDGIDVLVDLSGHMGDHRLPLFARRPAPVQVSWIGYFDTTGVPTMDYLIADRTVCPEGEDDRYVEQVVRLADAYMCYGPPTDAPAVARTEAETGGGPLVLGSFNRIAKVGDGMVGVWAAILRAIPASKLLLKTGDLADLGTRARYVRLFAAHGVTPDRLMLEGPSEQAGLLAAYQRVDVGLDTWPYSGATTTMEALWMGVPVVTLCGERFAGRTSATLLRAAGLPELVTATKQEYIDTTIALAADRPRLAALRAGLRAQVAQSPVCDARRFARGFERELRRMWRRWCNERNAR